MNKNWGGPYGQDVEFVVWAIALGLIVLCVSALIEVAYTAWRSSKSRQVRK